jgi:branched-chain amino acid transport system ATP-binding protein
VLEVRDLEVRYGRIAALRGVSLDVAQGELVGVVGPNGAGKTTLLSAITGLVRPAAGEVLFEGESVLGVPPEKVVRRGVALVPEGRRIFGSLTVRENLLLAGDARPSRDGLDDDMERALTRFPALRPLLGTPAGKLSGGEQQMLTISRALLCRPRLLLLDEPSLGLAPVIVDGIFDALAELHAEGVTILLVEQNVRRVLQVADRVYVFRTGEVGLSGTREELSDFERLSEAYLGAAV